MFNHVTLSQYSPFNIMSRELLVDIVSSAKFVTVSKGSMLFKRSKQLESSIFLLEGDVELIDNQFGAEKVKAGSIRAKRALNFENPTKVSAVAKSSVTYFTLNSEYIERMVTAESELASLNDCSRRAVDESYDWMSDVLHSPVFSRIPSKVLQSLFTKFEKMYAEEGEVVVKEGDEGDYFYVLSSGTAEITNHAGNLSLKISAGEYFGADALISMAPRNATVTMCENGVLQRLDKEDFVALVQSPVVKYMDPESLSAIPNEYKIIDVRMPIEYRMAHYPGSINVPLTRLRKTLTELGQDQTYLISDEAGARTDVAAYILCQAGFDAVVLSGASPDQSLSNA